MDMLIHVLPHIIWGAVAIAVAFRAIGKRRSDLELIKLKEGLVVCEANLNSQKGIVVSLAQQVSTFNARLNRLETPPARTQVF